MKKFKKKKNSICKIHLKWHCPHFFWCFLRNFDAMIFKGLTIGIFKGARAFLSHSNTGLRRFAIVAMQKPEVIFVLGGPGAGKGTTCAKIVDKTGYIHLSAGDLLREERTRSGSEFGELIETHIKNGSIVPVEITCSLINRAMQTSKCEHKRFLIDGFPRNQDNLDGWTKEMSDKAIVKGVIFLECSQEICTRRCLNRGLKGSGRSDDNEASLIKRHETFINDTMPIVKYYEERGLVYKFDSTKPPKAVFANVYKKLQEIGWADKE